MKKELKVSEEMIKDLYACITSLKNEEECAAFLDDLCTKNEIDQMACRIKAARLLMDGETYTRVIEQTNISSATLSRVSKSVKYGNGYKKVLDRGE